jgi:flagellin-like hook-associated protein FlgL
LFAGTQTSSPPFVKDNTSPSGVRYDGNNVVNSIQIGDGYQVAANKPGSQLFAAPGHDVFQAITDLITAVQSNGGFDTALASLRDSFDHISSQRVFYGNTLNQAQAQTTNLGNTKVQLASRKTRSPPPTSKPLLADWSTRRLRPTPLWPPSARFRS